MLVVREMIGTGIWVTSRLSMPQESALPPQSPMAPGRHPCYFNLVSCALMVHISQLEESQWKKPQALCVSRVTISDVVNEQVMGLRWVIEIV